MLPAPRRREIDHRTIKLLVGSIAITIAPLTSAFARTRLASISASYYEVGWSQSIFIGFLFAIGALLLAYNGYSRVEMVMSKAAAIAGVGIVLFPCQCGNHVEQIRHAHGIFAAVMFLILAGFCYVFLQRARAKPSAQARARVAIYVVCGIAIVVAVVVLAINNLPGAPVAQFVPRIIFYGETLGLVAFGVSWLTASRVFPGITSADERFSPLRRNNPE
jgi:hypothetical protein